MAFLRRKRTAPAKGKDPQTPTPVITLRDVSKLYGFGNATTVALEEINLSINKGEFVAVMGPSGSGKSTLLNIIGLLDRPTHGTYTLEERNVERLTHNRRAKTRRDKIGFIFQSFNLLPRLSVIENVALPLAYKGTPPVRRLKQASKILARVYLHEREYYLPKQLSGGQAQRAAIARALITDPSIIIADEPTGNLDSTSSRAVMELLGDIHSKGNTIIMVTHNPELTRYATRVIYMHDGSIIEDEPSRIGTVPARARQVAEPDDIPEESDAHPVVMLSTNRKSVGKPRKRRRKSAPRRKK